jgi:hypothetical protein
MTQKPEPYGVLFEAAGQAEDDWPPGLTPEKLAPLVAEIRGTLAADPSKAAVVMVTELHDVPYHARMPAILADALTKGGCPKPIIALECPHRFLEAFFEPDEGEPAQEEWLQFCKKALSALAQLKAQDPERYHALQSLAHRTTRFASAPLSQTNNMLHYRDRGYPVRFIDAARKHGPNGTSFLAEESLARLIRGRDIPPGAPAGMQLRNMFLQSQIEELARTHPGQIILVQTGEAHPGGDITCKMPYETALHPMLVTDGKPRCPAISKVFTLCSPSLYEGLDEEGCLQVQNGNGFYILLPSNAADSRQVFSELSKAGYESRTEIEELHTIHNEMQGLGGKVYPGTQQEYEAEIARAKNNLHTALTKLVMEYPETAPAPEP